jgi:hypothetical protein
MENRGRSVVCAFSGLAKAPRKLSRPAQARTGLARPEAGKGAKAGQRRRQCHAHTHKRGRTTRRGPFPISRLSPNSPLNGCFLPAQEPQTSLAVQLLRMRMPGLLFSLTAWLALFRAQPSSSKGKEAEGAHSKRGGQDGRRPRARKLRRARGIPSGNASLSRQRRYAHQKPTRERGFISTVRGGGETAQESL